MNPDYIFIFLIFLIILLFYLAIKYFKVLFFYLGVLLGILLGIYGKIFLEDKDFNLGFLNIFFNNISDFFKDSKIVNFLSENSGWLFLIFVILLFHKFFYYLFLILIHFSKWFITSIFDWLGNRKQRKNKIFKNNLETKTKNGQIIK